VKETRRRARDKHATFTDVKFFLLVTSLRLQLRDVQFEFHIKVRPLIKGAKPNSALASAS